MIKQTEQCFDTETQTPTVFTQMSVSVSCYCVVNSSLEYSILIDQSQHSEFVASGPDPVQVDSAITTSWMYNISYLSRRSYV